MRPFITGATGLVGANLVTALVESGVEPVCLVRDSLPTSLYETMSLRVDCVTVNGDIQDLHLLERVMVEYEIDTVFHLAAQTIVRYGHQGPLSTFETNVRGTWNVLEAARNKGRMERVVIASSDKAYGQHDPPYVETMALHGAYPYDVSKSCADLIAASYHETYSLPVTVVRCSNLYGPGDLNWSRIIPRTIRFAVKKDVDLKLRGRGLMKRDYMHVDDAVSGYLAAASKPIAVGRSYNFGMGEPISISGVVQMTLDLLDYKGEQPEVTQEGENEITDQWMDCSRAKADLGWAPTYNLHRGLNKTIQWYREYLA